MNQSKKREASFKSEQEREYEAMVSKTAHLRELGVTKLVARSYDLAESRWSSQSGPQYPRALAQAHD